jgi:hypothetical protein
MKKLSRDELKKVMGGNDMCDAPSGSCNPGPYYMQPCTQHSQCGWPGCISTLYCYNPIGKGGRCLFC